MLTKLLKNWVIQILAVSAIGLSWKTMLSNKKIPCVPPLLHGDK